MSLGTTLRQAREAKGASVSQVAEATRMMVQIVEDLERDDFRRVAAPIYGRGFIKLYAEHLGLDAEPLIREFMEIYTGTRPPQVVRRVAEAPADGAAVERSDSATAGVATAQTPDVPAVPPAKPAEPDLFSVAAGRSESVRTVADPAQPAEATPPRVRLAASARADVRPPSAASAEAPRRGEAPKPRDGLAEAPLAGSRPPVPWNPTVIVATAVGVILLILLGVVALSRKRPPSHHAKPNPVKIQRVLPPAPPYFD